MTAHRSHDADKTRVPRVSFLGSLRNNFFTGIVIAAPFFITIAVLYWMITGPLANLDSLVRENLPSKWLPDWALDDEQTPIVPGLGVLVAVILLIMLGMMAKNFIGRFFINLGERTLDSTPVVRNLYGFFKNVFEMALQQSEQSFKEVALIEYPRAGLWTLCFVVTSTKGEVKHKMEDCGDDLCNVFVPTTPNPTSGFLLFVPRSTLRILDMTVEDGAKMIFSAGLVAPEFAHPDLPVIEPEKVEKVEKSLFGRLRKTSPGTKTPPKDDRAD